MTIEERFEKAQRKAVKALWALDFVVGTPKKIRGLDGWVFEQVVRRSLEKEFRSAGIKADFSEQVSLGGRAKVDLVAGNAAIEIKISGFYDDVEKKYQEYRKRIEKMGLTYFYVTLYEEYLPNLAIAGKIYGKERVFVLSEGGAWGRFVKAVCQTQKKKA